MHWRSLNTAARAYFATSNLWWFSCHDAQTEFADLGRPSSHFNATIARGRGALAKHVPLAQLYASLIRDLGSVKVCFLCLAAGHRFTEQIDTYDTNGGLVGVAELETLHSGSECTALSTLHHVLWLGKR